MIEIVGAILIAYILIATIEWWLPLLFYVAIVAVVCALVFLGLLMLAA